MHVLYHRLDGHGDNEGGMKVRMSGEEMFFLRTRCGLARLLVQPFETDAPVGDLEPAIKGSAEFRRAWSAFLVLLETVKRTHDIVLDISDSRAGYTRERGNVMNTTNVVVRQGSEGGFLFTVIDPDVFDSDGTGKFCADEYLRREVREGLGLPYSLFMYAKLGCINFFRKHFVYRWQEESAARALAEPTGREET